MTAWRIGVDGWVLQDTGRDFRRGDRTVFSVMLHPLELRAAPEPARAARPVADANLYDVAGPIVYESAETLVLDCGLKLYLRRPEDLTDAAAVTGRGYLWMEAPGQWPWTEAETFPPLAYSWEIERIRLETTPWVPISGGANAFQRDLSRQSFEEIDATDAMGANDRRDRLGPDYVFDCRLLDEPPRAVR
jgi:hypothetical protein